MSKYILIPTLPAFSRLIKCKCIAISISLFLKLFDSLGFYRV